MSGISFSGYVTSMPDHFLTQGFPGDPIFCRNLSAKFPRQKPPYAGQSSIFLVKIHTAEKIDIYV